MTTYQGVFKNRKRILRKLAKKDPKVIKNIRQMFFDDSLENFDPEEDTIKELKKRTERMTKKDLFNYWDLFYDSNLDPVVSRKLQKTLTEKEKAEFL